jgi:hypothetical protein
LVFRPTTTAPVYSDYYQQSFWFGRLAVFVPALTPADLARSGQHYQSATPVRGRFHINRNYVAIWRHLMPDGRRWPPDCRQYFKYKIYCRSLPVRLDANLTARLYASQKR